MIALALIPHDSLREATSLAAALAEAVDRGDMPRADHLTLALLAAAREDRQVRIALAPWLEFTCHVRQAMPAFEAGYLIGSDVCGRLLSLEGVDAVSGLRAALEAAVASRSHLLQIPLDAE